jgi:hypothetical protein
MKGAKIILLLLFMFELLVDGIRIDLHVSLEIPGCFLEFINKSRDDIVLVKTIGYVFHTGENDLE